MNSFKENFTSKLSTSGALALASARKSFNKIEHGMYAHVPIVCKAEGCPYYGVCSIKDEINLSTIIGEPCPVEMAELIELHTKYSEQFKLDEVDNLSLEGLVRELIDKEIQIRRCDKYISLEADFMEEIEEYDKFGNTIVHRELSKPVEYKEKLNKRKGDILQLLYATPKDKAGLNVHLISDPSSYASALFERQQAEKLLLAEEVLVIESEDDAKDS